MIVINAKKDFLLALARTYTRVLHFLLSQVSQNWDIILYINALAILMHFFNTLKGRIVQNVVWGYDFEGRKNLDK